LTSGGFGCVGGGGVLRAAARVPQARIALQAGGHLDGMILAELP